MILKASCIPKQCRQGKRETLARHTSASSHSHGSVAGTLLCSQSALGWKRSVVRAGEVRQPRKWQPVWYWEQRQWFTGGTGDGNHTACRHAACTHVNGAEEMWQEKTKQKVCHMICNNEYLVVKSHPTSASGGQQKQIVTDRVRQTWTDTEEEPETAPSLELLIIFTLDGQEANCANSHPHTQMCILPL